MTTEKRTHQPGGYDNNYYNGVPNPLARTLAGRPSIGDENGKKHIL